MNILLRLVNVAQVETKTQHSQIQICTLVFSLQKLEANVSVCVLSLQLRAFSELKFHDGKAMVGTFRPVQPLNGRQVFRSGGAVILASSAFLVAAVVTALGLSQPN